jgi:DNA recombination protein RmuC
MNGSTLATLVTVLIALVCGLIIGSLLAARRADSRLRRSHAEVAALRHALESQRSATQHRDELLLQHGDLVDLLGPLRDSLSAVTTQLGAVERGRVESDVALREQVVAMGRASEHLHRQTGQLLTALRAPHVRGRWGEMQLERVVEAAGMTEHVDYDTQVSSAGEDGMVRPDMVVRLTGGKNVVVDAKVACHAYLDALEATDEATRNNRFKAHARQLRTHIDALAAKGYWERFSPTPEFVVCFVPADAFLDAALREDPSLLEHAFTRHVVLATPSTLVALLRTVGYGWRQEALAANAREIQQLGRDLYRRLATLGGHFDKLGRSLGTAVGAYNDAVGSMEHMVLSKARQLAELGIADPALAPNRPEPLVSVAPRPLTAPEFTDPKVVPLPERVGIRGDQPSPSYPG